MGDQPPKPPEVLRIRPKAKYEKRREKIEAGRRDAAQLRFRTWHGVRFAPQQIPILRPSMSSIAKETWHGSKVERIPWGDGKHGLTTTYRWFLANWAKRLSWKEVAEAFGTTWQNVFRSVKHAVSWGLEHRDLEGIESIGVDEVQWQRGHKYLTLVYQIDAGRKRLLWIGQHRTAKTFLRFFRMLGKERSGRLKFICSDMWQPYLKVIAKKAAQAIHVLDRFHIMQKMNKAIDKVRAGEARQMKADGYEEILKHSRGCLLKRPENMTDKQTVKLAELLKYNLRAVRAYLLKKRTFSNSGNTSVPFGRQSSSTSGVRERCVRNLNQ